MKWLPGMMGLLLILGFAPQQQKVSQEEIDKAIKKGADFLLQKNGALTEKSDWYELVVYTLMHADVDPTKSDFLKSGIERLITLEPTVQDDRATYRCAVQSLALHSLLLKVSRHPSYAKLFGDKIAAIQERIALCGQTLVDSQLANGQWTYRATRSNTPEKEGIINTGTSPKEKERLLKKPPKEIDSAGSKLAWENAVEITGTIYRLKQKYAASGDGDGTGIKQPRQASTASGDNSNTQYAILGLIAAQMSGCIVPEGTWERALEWFEGCQNEDGGFGYSSRGSAAKGNDASYGSMTTAGLIALASGYRYLAKKPLKDDKKGKNSPVMKALMKNAKLAQALEWLSKNYVVNDNPGKLGVCPYYYLYGLERVGAFLETEEFDKHRWYDEGAAWLVKDQQQADGSWPGTWSPTKDISNRWDLVTINSCFAILFLKRATKDIIETGTGGGDPPVIEQK